MKAIFDSGATSIHSFPVLTTGHDFLHSCRHFYTVQKETLDLRNSPVNKREKGLPSVCTGTGEGKKTSAIKLPATIKEDI